MKIMTANIWGDYFDNPVSAREARLYSALSRYDADVIGFQEVTQRWWASGLFDRLADRYTILGEASDAANNYTPLAVKKELRPLAVGFEYLLDTPDGSKSITWAVLAAGDAARRFAVCNTHFWWRAGEEHDRIREKNAAQLARLMQFLHEKYDCPAFAFGDMNCTIASPAFQIYAPYRIVHLRDAAKTASSVSSHHGDPQRGADGEYHGERTTDDFRSSIDHILALGDGFTVQDYHVVEDSDALDASDHSPVCAAIFFND